MLAVAAPANAGVPSVTISESATAGAAPLTVTLEAHGDAASYRWELGNGETAEGPTVSATYGPGLWTVTVTATAADGETAQASVTVRSVAVALLPPATSRYGGAPPLPPSHAPPPPRPARGPSPARGPGAPAP